MTFGNHGSSVCHGMTVKTATHTARVVLCEMKMNPVATVMMLMGTVVSSGPDAGDMLKSLQHEHQQTQAEFDGEPHWDWKFWKTEICHGFALHL